VVFSSVLSAASRFVIVATKMTTASQRRKPVDSGERNGDDNSGMMFLQHEFNERDG
jgi:hypothetical protein